MNECDITNHIYDQAVRAFLRCPDVPEHAHISIDTLKGMIDDPEAFRAALGAAVTAWESEECDRYQEGHSCGWSDGWQAAVDRE